MAIDVTTLGPGFTHGPGLGFPSRTGLRPEDFGLPSAPTLPIRPGNDFINVLNKLRSQVGVGVSPAKLYLAIKSLSASDTATLTNQFLSLKPLAEHEQGEFTTKVSQALSSEEGRTTLEDAALAAARACKDIKHQFIELRLALKAIGDAQPGNQSAIQGLQERLQKCEKKYDGVIEKCKELSMQISVYCEQFQGSLMPYVQAPIETNEKEDFINKYIKKTEEFGDLSKKIEEELNSLHSNFGNLMTEFLNFTNNQQPDLAGSIQQIESKIQELNKRLAALKSQLTAMNIGRGVIGPVATALATLFPPASVYILAAGLVGVGALSVAAACVGAEIETIEEEKISLEREIEMLKTAGNKYMESAARLKELSNDADAKFSVSVELIKDVLQNLTVDTAAIAQWLREGGDMLVRPSTYVFKTLLTEDLTDHVMLFPGRSPSGGKLI
ncbi:hypothetical protein KXX16_009158 [Aspergillus fumigatus]|uniref:Uncharacterized protein n=1 Tax=Aspergillus fumigatus TaxID=746128 RepID=A0A9P8SR21_ASPFM|nr:hypothetical protein KXX16_009158 [Aspergillus fumigatus]KAH1755409.1 hypothetical protein KXX09_004452 [Aspergillus fumigatus]KAH1901157.1 hypothetical protein KXV57_007982 [Aspergillus fumigatus]KAH1969325.1 hypothetical protein KXX04_008344 [Aspergillus fumigatus]KAH2607727.1 hypothetical protein KXW93_005672 [Aspergillus fumigatus]